MTDPLCYSSALAFENQNQRGKAMKYQWIFLLLCPFEAPNTGPRSGPSVLLAFQTLPEGSTLKQLAGSSESQENSVSWREKRRSQSLLAWDVWLGLVALPASGSLPGAQSALLGQGATEGPRRLVCWLEKAARLYGVCETLCLELLGSVY